jgi:3-hydroxyisobutyrate dehydrogenase-like beta-hydroxyacid dehydrogenase
MRIAFIGLGLMGRAIAANLQRAGHALSVHDLRRESARELLAAGATWAEGATEAARGCELVFTSLPGPEEIARLAPGLAEGMARGSVWFDLTTNAPSTVRRLHGEFLRRGVHLLDAPVSGGPEGAREAKLALWVGGDRAQFERYQPALRSIGDRVLYLGAIGAGSVAKLVHNCASFALQTALAEAFTLGVKAGVEPLALFGALRQGALGRKRAFDRLPEHFLSGDYDPPAHSLRLAHKDMLLVAALAEENGVSLPTAAHALDELEAALARGWGERDARIAMALVEERAGVSVRVPRERLREIMQGD